jgi:hypothetical protein
MPFGVTGDELPVKGEQMVTFTVGGETYNHEFCVCKLATDADAILGMDFLRKMDAHLDFEREKLRLKRAESLDKDASTGGRYGSRGTAVRAALTVLPHLDGRVRPKSRRMRREKQQIQHADALSRAVKTVAQDRELSRDVVKTAQEADKFCQTLKPGTPSGKSEYFLDEEGLIFRRRKNGEHQLVVPSSLTHEVIRMNHEPPTVAHPGRTRTLDILCLRFYWPGMRRQVEEYVKKCHSCQWLKPRHQFKAPPRDVMEPTREMVHPSMQSLRAKLPLEISNTDHAPRLENLKSKLRTAYELARDHGRKSHATNKRYYDRSAREREFAVGDFVYLYNPAIKVGASAKFRRPWVGTWRITEKKSWLNYVIVNQRGKQLVVHVNRLKTAYDPVDWQETKREKPEQRVRPKRRQQGG